jgi:hypothetical protein
VLVLEIKVIKHISALLIDGSFFFQNNFSYIANPCQFKSKKIKNEIFIFFSGTPFSSGVTRKSATPMAAAFTSWTAIRFATPEFKESSLSSGKSDQSTTSEIGTS